MAFRRVAIHRSELGSGENYMQSKLRFSKFQLLALVVMMSVAAIGVFSVPAKADNLYASIRGSITDPTGAVVSGVSVTATNAATGIAYTTTTNSSGAFTFLQLPIGDYTLKVAQPGYKAYEAAG